VKQCRERCRVEVRVLELLHERLIRERAAQHRCIEQVPRRRIEFRIPALHFGKPLAQERADAHVAIVPRVFALVIAVAR